MQEGYPFRPKGMHFVNTHTFMETMFKLFQSFNKDKINRRVRLQDLNFTKVFLHATNFFLQTFVHGKDIEAMYEKVPKRLLPTEYGGEAGPLSELTGALFYMILYTPLKLKKINCLQPTSNRKCLLSMTIS